MVPLLSIPPWSIIWTMSREDPQFKLRMPADLRMMAEQAAKAAGRSLNAELVSRLETSFLALSEPEKLMPAEKARELAALARSGIPEQIRRRVLREITKSVGLGHSSTSVDLRDLKLDGGLNDEEIEELTSEITQELVGAGYTIDWDGGSWIWIKF